MGAVKISPFYRTARARWHAERQSKCLGSRRSGLADVVSTRAAPSSASVEPIYTLSNAPIVSEGWRRRRYYWRRRRSPSKARSM